MYNENDIIKLALAEDLGFGDVTTSAIFGSGKSPSVSAEVVSKSDFILSGSKPFKRVFAMLSDSLAIQFLFEDGQLIHAGKTLVKITGEVAAILKGERTALNFLQHLSGVASKTKQFCDILAGTTIALRDTRKTTPGLRFWERAAVRHGGGVNHRFNLATGILIKENHIKAAGSISEAIRLVKKKAPKNLEIEVETESLAEVREAADCGVDVIMLDDLPISELASAISIIGGRSKIEVSGGIHLQNIAQYRSYKIDFISTSSITRSAEPVDVSMRIA